MYHCFKCNGRHHAARSPPPRQRRRRAGSTSLPKTPDIDSIPHPAHDSIPSPPNVSTPKSPNVSTSSPPKSLHDSTLKRKSTDAFFHLMDSINVASQLSKDEHDEQEMGSKRRKLDSRGEERAGIDATTSVVDPNITVRAALIASSSLPNQAIDGNAKYDDGVIFGGCGWRGWDLLCDWLGNDWCCGGECITCESMVAYPFKAGVKYDPYFLISDRSN